MVSTTCAWTVSLPFSRPSATAARIAFSISCCEVTPTILRNLRSADPPFAAAAVVAVVGALTICGFFFFQYALGYPPCPLCLDQRNAFYVSVPLAALLWLGAHHGASSKVMIAGFAVIAAIMLW